MLTGKLDRRLEIIKGELGEPSGPLGERTWVYTTIRTVWAARIFKREDESFDPDTKQRFAMIQATFRLRWDPDLTPTAWLTTEETTWRVRCDSVTYRVTGAREIGRKSGLEIQAEAVQ